MERYQVVCLNFLSKKKNVNIATVNTNLLALMMQGRKLLLFFKFASSKFCTFLYGESSVP